MMRWNDKPYHSLDYELKRRFGEKVYRLSLNGGMTCPNRDGRIGYGGCIFCSAGGSGEFAADPSLSIRQQIDAAKKLLEKKRSARRYIAYILRSRYGWSLACRPFMKTPPPSCEGAIPSPPLKTP